MPSGRENRTQNLCVSTMNVSWGVQLTCIEMKPQAHNLVSACTAAFTLATNQALMLLLCATPFGRTADDRPVQQTSVLHAAPVTAL